VPAVLDITALRSIVAVADQGGFHRAAEALMLSQSAVSQHVRRLEKAVGRPLVRKDGRASRFTPEGEALVGEASWPRTTTRCAGSASAIRASRWCWAPPSTPPTSCSPG